MFGSRPSGAPFRYWAGELWTDELDGDVAPQAALHVPLDGETLSRGVVWTGDAGVTASMHHDRSYNFFTQVSGKKRFLIYPPSAHWALHVNPSFHPSRRQTGMHAESFGRFVKENRNLPPLPAPIIVNVEKGDLLYIPPFYFHEVETITQSVSYSIVSPSREEFLLSSLTNLQIDFGKYVGEERKLAIVVFIDELLSTLDIPSSFLYHLMLSRYPNSSKSSTTAHLPCLVATSDERAQIGASLSHFDETIALFRRIFAENDKIFQNGKKQLVLADVVDQLVLFGGGEQGDLLRDCWTFEE
eukprot:TRINITY_DN4097_c0_g1_i1.p1 TRINITY_DN4097_c0_g1~~TRINITY_DN4097_c0_g1_i1.p1  ORF type:complete len:349 (+),score=15.40 TRINITY_DN4097_c0_g1_i1:148-1047(+)